MSRTYRRKGKVPVDYEWEILQDLTYSEITGHFEWTDLKGKALAKSLANYHSDKWQSCYSAPAVFRRGINQRFRIKNKEILSTINLKGNYEDYIFIPFRKNVIHEWT